MRKEWQGMKFRKINDRFKKRTIIKFVL
jgi:hypothetical protein